MAGLMASIFPALKSPVAAATPPLQKVIDPLPIDSLPAGERRTAERLLASLIPSITGMRLSPIGGDASLVNISTGGILWKANVRLMPGTMVTITLHRTAGPLPVAGRVVHCMVADIDAEGVLWYHVGAAFSQAITLEDLPGAANAYPAPAPQPRKQQTVSNRW
jgi:hypothetical protein